MKAKVGGITYFFDEPIEHKMAFWKAAFKNLIRLNLIESFDNSWELFLKELE
mgnify:CR=1 FL=1